MFFFLWFFYPLIFFPISKSFDFIPPPAGGGGICNYIQAWSHLKSILASPLLPKCVPLFLMLSWEVYDEAMFLSILIYMQKCFEWWKKWMTEWMNDQINERPNEWMNERPNEWITEWMEEWPNEWMNDRMNDWMYNQLNEWMTHWTNDDWLKE